MAGRAESERYGCHMTLATHYLNKFLKEKYECVSLVLNVKWEQSFLKGASLKIIN